MLGETCGLKLFILFVNCLYECNAFFMEEHCTVGSLYLFFYVVSRNICTSSTLFISKIFPTYNDIILVIFIFMTNTDTFYARYLNTAVCATGYNLPIVHYIIEVHMVTF